MLQSERGRKILRLQYFFIEIGGVYGALLHVFRLGEESKIIDLQLSLHSPLMLTHWIKFVSLTSPIAYCYNRYRVDCRNCITWHDIMTQHSTIQLLIFLLMLADFNYVLRVLFHAKSFQSSRVNILFSSIFSFHYYILPINGRDIMAMISFKIMCTYKYHTIFLFIYLTLLFIFQNFESTK